MTRSFASMNEFFCGYHSCQFVAEGKSPFLVFQRISKIGQHDTVGISSSRSELFSKIIFWMSKFPVNILWRSFFFYRQVFLSWDIFCVFVIFKLIFIGKFSSCFWYFCSQLSSSRFYLLLSSVLIYNNMIVV